MAKAKVVPDTVKKIPTKKATAKAPKKATKASGKVSKVTRAKNEPTTAETPKTLAMADMVRDAFENTKGSKGTTLQAIRIYITKKYDVEMTKRRQNIMKKFVKDEFDEGRMRMTNHKGDQINYSKRFKVTASSSN